ncbi:casein kinase II subunit beta-2, putative [Entamoeba dispar SAW760]|uniref:Casein kinase II subunit beta n=1 Tax=Entamoeba dispar (strain ATCC PRA-260 / SAW760) TaxID=370354 RepID=B0E8L3_ENTDS|nr:casein kinase II subunit beta-2, putative [Entamoeba dispar SAW760]EDR29156.1 casein kinase II subunit beta-2, putative [Entamoeba dispar SAW760]|eukprot:EDR29156.1 casein kinase II subunit beta-2, putative [Entamoeba dispar SAW760]
MKRREFESLVTTRRSMSYVQTHFEILFDCFLKDMLLSIDKNYLADPFNSYGMYDPNDNFQNNVFLCLSNKVTDSIDNVEQFCDFFYDPNKLDKAIIELYGKIHAQYLLTYDGCKHAKKAWKEGFWGSCRNQNCKGYHLLPYGKSYIVNQYPMNLYCGCCGKLYSTDSEGVLDGAYFGPWFIPNFFLEYPELLPHSSYFLKTIPQCIYGYTIIQDPIFCESLQHENPPLPSRTFVHKTML